MGYILLAIAIKIILDLSLMAMVDDELAKKD